MGRLDDVDLTQKLKGRQYDEALEAAQTRLAQLRLTLGGLTGEEVLGPGLLVLLEGWDASGKGGAIKRLVERLDPRHVRVVSFSAPTPDEKRHHFLHRFQPALPGLGGMAVLDRTWYGRVLVERVEGFSPEAVWRRAFDEINDHERLLHDEGVIVVKLFLHLSDEEQLRRFEARAADPLKSWKLTDEDWRNRGKRDAYLAATEEMFERTHTGWAPWRIIAGDNKKHARVAVLREVIEAVEAGAAERGFALPEPTAAA